MDTSIHNISFSGCDNNSITYLVCGVHDRLILDTFDAQDDFKAQPRDILGSTYTDIRMYQSTISDFFLACPGSSDLDRAQEARWGVCLFVCFPRKRIILHITYQSNRMRRAVRGYVRFRHSRP
jgi:hypothetical protein